MPQGVWILTVPGGVALAVLVFLLLRAKLPFLKLVPSPVEQSALRRAQEAESELARANTAIESLSKQRDDLLKERSLAEVINLVQKVASGVDQTLAKLADLNGGLSHTASALKATNENLQTSTRAIELLASQIIIDIREKGIPT